MTAVMDTRPVYALEIRAADSTSARRARRWLSYVLEHAQISQGLADTAALVASELVTNAAIHVGGRILVSLELTAPGVRLSVWDAGTTPVSAWASAAGDGDERGRGLILARGLSTSLRTDVDESGTTVIADLA